MSSNKVTRTFTVRPIFSCKVKLDMSRPDSCHEAYDEVKQFCHKGYISDAKQRLTVMLIYDDICAPEAGIDIYREACIQEAK